MIKKKSYIRLLAMLLAVFLFVTMFPDMYEGSHVEATISSIYNANNNISYNTHEKNANGQDLNRGMIVVPEAEGKYPVLFFIHGSGGEEGWNSTIARYADYWYRQGYIDPMVIVVPNIGKYQEAVWGTKDFKDYVKEGYLRKIVDALKSANVSTIMNTLGVTNAADAEKLISRVDVNAPMSITGFSMGGACSLYAGCKMNDVFINVGGLSPASSFYNATVGGGNENWFMAISASELVFSQHEDAHMLMAYGDGEKDGSGNVGAFKVNVTNFNTAIEANGLNKKNCFTIKGFSKDYGEHANKLFRREIFTFLYYVKNEELPTAEIIELACRNDTSQDDFVKDVGNNGMNGFVRISGTPKVGQTLTVSIQDSKATNLSYQWRRGKENISGATGTTYKLTSADLGKKISCKVSDASGSRTGFVSGATAEKVTQESGSTPTPNPTTAPTVKPTVAPTAKPTAAPTAKPTAAPTTKPTAAPTAKPTAAPTVKPTTKPTAAPTVKPTAAPTAKPTAAPTAKPTAAPTAKPTAAPTAKPTAAPTVKPTAKPTAAPTAKPTAAPTAKPTAAPTAKPTAVPTAKPTAAPTAKPTAAPTAKPTAAPTAKPTTEVTSVFADVPAGKWFVNAVQFVYDRGIMNGKGADPKGSGKLIFDPNASLTRAEFATLLYSMEGKPAVSFNHTILDVKNNSAWYAKPVHWVYENNIAAGYPNGNYGVADPITREQLALMLYKYAKLKEYKTTYSENSLDRFGDTNKISNWAVEAMKWATSNGVMNGSAHEVPLLNPKGNATRAECAAMIKSLFEKVIAK